MVGWSWRPEQATEETGARQFVFSVERWEASRAERGRFQVELGILLTLPAKGECAFVLREAAIHVESEEIKS